MRWFVPMALASGLVSCSGDTGTKPEEPEVCDDGVDNNGNGLVDCDDTKYCGGVRCVTTGDDDDDAHSGQNLPPVDVDYTGADINFTFASGTCPIPVQAFQIVDRSDDDGTVDASCDLVNNDDLLRYQVDGGQAKTFVVDEPLVAGGRMQLNLFFAACNTQHQAFTTRCRVKGEVDGYIDEVEFDVTGTPQ